MSLDNLPPEISNNRKRGPDEPVSKLDKICSPEMRARLLELVIALERVIARESHKALLASGRVAKIVGAKVLQEAQPSLDYLKNILNQPINVTNLDKRELAKVLATSLAILTASYVATDKVVGGVSSLMYGSKQQGESVITDPEEEQVEKKVSEEDAASIREIIDFGASGPLSFGSREVGLLKNYWIKMYQGEDENRPELSQGLQKELIRAYEDMGEWRPELERIFKEEGVPVEYIYLAIPESHWKFKAKSPVAAAGPYQFMPKTGRDYKLKIDGVMDERLDPLKSARACAKYLKDLHDLFKNWDIALSGYNGGFIWKYRTSLKEYNFTRNFFNEQRRDIAKQLNLDNSDPRLDVVSPDYTLEDASYEGYLKFIEKRLNEVRDGLKSPNGYEITVKKGQTLGRIAAIYKIPVALIYDENGQTIRDPSLIRVGQKLKLRPHSSDAEKVFWAAIRGFNENLNYPAKFWAVQEVLAQLRADGHRQKNPLHFDTFKVQAPPVHMVHKGHSPDLIARRYGVDLKELVAINPWMEKTQRISWQIKRNRRGKVIKRDPVYGKVLVIRPGQKVKLPYRVGACSLAGVAKKVGNTAEQLRTVNPGILDPNAILPVKYSLRHQVDS
jgi:LysM repeat protein